MKEPLENFDYSGEPQFTGISKATARDLADRYKKECQPLLTSRMQNATTNMDARSIVFPIEKLKKFIWEIENSVRKIPDVGELGIRMYYGKYPDIAAIKRDKNHPMHLDMLNLPDEYSFHHTLFLVPTCKEAGKIDRDFDPWQAAANGRITQLDATSDTITDSTKRLMTSQMNHGNISPPPFSADDRDSRNQGLSF